VVLTDDGKIRFFDVTKSVCILELAKLQKVFTCFLVFPLSLVSSVFSAPVLFHYFSTSLYLALLLQRGHFTSFSLSFNGKYLAAVTKEGLVDIYDVYFALEKTMEQQQKQKKETLNKEGMSCTDTS